MIIGAQMFTVREFAKTVEDFAETLKKIADIGYTTVQVSGTCEFDPAWLKSELDKNGLQCVITHIPAQYLLVEQDNCNGEDPFDCLKRIYENLRAIGLQLRRNDLWKR